MSEFWDSYKRPEWQKRRLEVMSKAEFRCVDCGTGNATLNVHHAFYEKDRKPWEYADYALRCLCENCHKKRHGISDMARMTANLISMPEAERLCGYVEALFASYEPGYTIRIRTRDHARGVADAIGLPSESVIDAIVEVAKRLDGVSVSDIGQILSAANEERKGQ